MLRCGFDGRVSLDGAASRRHCRRRGWRASWAKSSSRLRRQTPEIRPPSNRGHAGRSVSICVPRGADRHASTLSRRGDGLIVRARASSPVAAGIDQRQTNQERGRNRSCANFQNSSGRSLYDSSLLARRSGHRSGRRTSSLASARDERFERRGSKKYPGEMFRCHPSPRRREKRESTHRYAVRPSPLRLFHHTCRDFWPQIRSVTEVTSRRTARPGGERRIATAWPA